MPIFEQYDVVVVPFPFTDRQQAKRRPALVLSDPSTFTIDKSILTMITSSRHQSWSLDTEIENLQMAGLKSPSIVRMKMFTLENTLIVKKIGRLSNNDSENMSFNLIKAFNL